MVAKGLEPGASQVAVKAASPAEISADPPFTAGALLHLTGNSLPPEQDDPFTGKWEERAERRRVPKSIDNKGSFWFEDAHKEELVDRWEEALDTHELVLHQPEEVVDAIFSHYEGRGFDPSAEEREVLRHL